MAEMTAEEYLDWISYNEVEPLPYPWAQTGMTIAAIKSVFSGKAHKASEFMPTHITPAKPKASTEQLRAGMSWLAGLRLAHQQQDERARARVKTRSG